MYQRILLPTDGSEASGRAVAAGIAFAGELGADVVVLNATPPFQVFSTDAAMLADTPERHAEASRQRAEQLLAPIGAAAAAAGVRHQLEHLESDQPWQAIVATAERLGCDLVVMASHGRRGIAGLLLGSETQKVLVHGAIPVLVHR